jgi:hypothetical protein
MADPPASRRGIGATAVSGLLLVALGCGFDALGPTVRVTCPARSAVAPDCELRWLIAFETLTIRHVPLPALQPVGETEVTFHERSRPTEMLYFDTAAGRVSASRWRDHMSFQKDLQEPLRAYFANPRAAAIEVTMRPVEWVAPTGDASGGLARRTHPVKIVTSVIIGVGLLFWMWIPVQLAMSWRRRSRS